MLSFQVILHVAVMLRVIAGSEELCPSFHGNVWYKFENSCYEFCTKEFFSRKSWQTALYYCARMGSNLVSIHSSAENQWIHKKIRQFHPKAHFLWTGGRTLTGSVYEWSDNTPFDFLNWVPGEPNDLAEECVAIYTGSGQWNDDNCKTKAYPICKMAYPTPINRTNHTQEATTKLPTLEVTESLNTETENDGANHTNHTLETETKLTTLEVNASMNTETEITTSEWMETTAVTEISAQLLRGSCPSEWHRLDKKCARLFISDSPLNYANASKECQKHSENSTLVTISSEHQQRFLWSLLSRKAEPAWIGLKQEKYENKFKWEDQSTVDYVNWDRTSHLISYSLSRPPLNVVCAQMWRPHGLSGAWVLRDCFKTTTKAYFCQTPLVLSHQGEFMGVRAVIGFILLVLFVIGIVGLVILSYLQLRNGALSVNSNNYFSKFAYNAGEKASGTGECILDDLD